jgi:hypothetical protein
MHTQTASRTGRSIRLFTLLSFVLSALGAALGTIATPIAAHAYDYEGKHGDFGLGAVLGDPTAVTAKVWTHPDEAFDVGIGYDLNNFFLIDADYLWHFPEWFAKTSVHKGTLMPYIGVGGILWVNTASNRATPTYFTNNGSVGIGVRVPVGIEWLPGKPPLGLFAELVPGVGLVPGVFAFLQGGVGARFYF